MRFFLLPVLNVIPFNLVCLHLQRKTAAITTINHSFLAGICIIDHAEPAIFHIGMYFHIEVGTEPLMQILLSVGTPQNTAVQNTAVLKAVRQTADINTAPLSKLMDSHLHFLLPLYQNFRVLVSEDVLFTLTKVHWLRGICQNEVIGMLLPVIFIVV